MKLTDFQNKIIEEKRQKVLLGLGTGTGKTKTALSLLDPNDTTLIIAPLQQIADKSWEFENAKWEINRKFDIISKDKFRNEFLKGNIKRNYTALIVDEAHYFFTGVSTQTRSVKKQITPKVSGLYYSLHSFIADNPQLKIIFCTATPLATNNPMMLLALAWLMGKNWDYFKFKEKFYSSFKRGFVTFYKPISNPEIESTLKKGLRPFGYFGTLFDFENVPEQSYIEKHFSLTKEQTLAIKNLKANESDPNKVPAKIRQIENGIMYTPEGPVFIKNQKNEYIIERANEFPKMIIFANWIAQIDSISSDLNKNGFKVLKLFGGLKKEERQSVIEQAEKLEKVIVVAQSSISSGYNLPSIPVMIFASHSPLHRDRIQGEGRILRAGHLKKNLYISLVLKNGYDEKCYKSVINGKNFYEETSTTN